MSQKIGFIGLGMMGTPMVRRLLGAGHAVTVCDLDADAMGAATASGARTARTPSELAAQCDVVMVSLPTPDVVRRVALGPDGLHAGGRAKIYVDLSTTGARVAREVAAGLAPHGIAALDAPVSGGPSGAAAGTLSIMVSGDPAAFETIRPVLAAMGSNTRLVGTEVGQGQMLKLVNNLMLAANYAVASECLVMGVKAGLDPSVMVDVVNKSSGRSFASENFVPGPVLQREFNFGFRMELMCKDVRLALEEAEALGTPMFACAAARHLYNCAVGHGQLDDDVTSLIKLLEHWGGAVVAAKPRDTRTNGGE